MPQFGTVHLSDSLFKLLSDNSKKSKCVRLLYDILLRMQSGAQAKGDCPCPECRRARKGKVLLNPKLIGDFFSFREKQGMISYCPKGKTQAINEDGSWVRKGRVEIKPAKWIKSMLAPAIAKRLKDHEYSPFDTILKAEEEAQRIKFEFVPFRDAYNSNKYGDHVPDSCMFGKPVEEFYELMGAKVLVAMNGHGVYYGRAVFWPNVKTDRGKVIQFLDRIYSRNAETTQLFKDYAREQGWHWKYKQNRSTLKEVYSPDEEPHSYNMTVECDEEFPERMYFPFLDTFQGGRDNSSITNVVGSGTNGIVYGYATTNGEREEFEDHTGEVQTYEGYWIPQADQAYAPSYGIIDRNDSRFVLCSHTGDWMLRRHCVYIAHKDFWVHQDYENQYLTPEQEEEERKAKEKRKKAQEARNMKGLVTNFTWQPIAIDTAYDPGHLLEGAQWVTATIRPETTNNTIQF